MLTYRRHAYGSWFSIVLGTLSCMMVLYLAASWGDTETLFYCSPFLIQCGSLALQGVVGLSHPRTRESATRVLHLSYLILVGSLAGQLLLGALDRTGLMLVSLGTMPATLFLNATEIYPLRRRLRDEGLRP